MLTVLLALAAAVSYSGSDYTAGLATRGASVVRVTVIAEVTNAVLLISVVPFASSQSPSLPALAWGATAGVSGVAGAMALYLGFRHAAFSVASSVSAVGSAAFAVLAGLLLGERPGALSLVGIALALPAIAAVSVSTGPANNGLLTRVMRSWRVGNALLIRPGAHDAALPATTRLAWVGG
jgi:drug/metabolite transporter (DMT)-like permease